MAAQPSLLPQTQFEDGHVFPGVQPHKLENLRGPGCSNVLIRGCLLLGPHPGSSTSEIVATLRPLLLAGVTTFVCLQAELPSAATSAAPRGAHGARPYIAEAQAMVDAGGYRQSGSALSFVHVPMPATPGFCPDDATLKKLVRRMAREKGTGF